MKYIKTYEDTIKDNLKVNDYIICGSCQTGNDDNLTNFVKSNIGQIIRIYDTNPNEYVVQYNIDIPKNLKQYFHDPKHNYFQGPRPEIENCRIITDKDVIFSSSDKEDAEDFLKAKEYNL